MKAGRLSRSLEIVSLPMLDDRDVFWIGLIRFCKKHRVTHLKVETFASRVTHIPSVNGETNRRERSEFLLELQNVDLQGKLSKNHARNIKRGRKAGLCVQRASNQKACQAHAKLIAESMTRRGDRGERRPENIAADAFGAYTHSGAGEYFRPFLTRRYCRRSWSCLQIKALITTRLEIIPKEWLSGHHTFWSKKSQMY